MKFSLFYHSLVSDWNHGNAHFLRGVVSELLARGHEVQVFEPEDSWSRANLLRDHGEAPLQAFAAAYPELETTYYQAEPLDLDLDAIISGADVIIVHEWNTPALVNAIGQARARLVADAGCLLFHDTHHRAVSEPRDLEQFKLEPYDGVLAFGEVLSEVYRQRGWGRRVWTWHEAADTRVFYPRGESAEHPCGDLVWVGNWGDDERTAELETFLFGPVRKLGLSANIFGVRYPDPVLAQLKRDGIAYHGWLPNFEAPPVFANHAVTVHVPRRYYATTLPGIPTIRPFEAMACGIPLICAPWSDSEGLFTPGEDYLVARDGEEMQAQLRDLIHDREFARAQASRALATIRARHTCGHRVEQLLGILQELGVTDPAAAKSAEGDLTDEPEANPSDTPTATKPATPTWRLSSHA